MKTAVIISGQMRTFAKCYPTQRWQIFRHYEPDIHFYGAVCNDEQKDDLGKMVSPDYPVEYIYLDDPSDLPDIPMEKGRHAPYANATTHYRLMLQHWGNKKAWEFFSSKADPSSFDTIIRIRPDLWIHRFIKPKQPAIDEICCPWWGKFGGINDRLAVMGLICAERYFQVYDEILELLEAGCPFHPETLVLSALLPKNDVPVSVNNTLMTEFSTERMDGSRRWAEIVMSDIAELIANTR